MEKRPAFPRIAAAAAVMVFLWGCAGVHPARRDPPKVAGRVTYRGAPVPGARVTFYDRYEAGGKHEAASFLCGDDGGFGAELSPGTYFVEASGRFEGKEVFAFSGRNPLRIDTGKTFLGMKAVPVEGAEVLPGVPGQGAAVEGFVVHQGMPVEGAYVFVYASCAGMLKGMGIAMSPPTGPDGRFAVLGLPESAYWIVARRRGAGGTTGPLEKGDLFGFFPGNPVYLKDGFVTRLRLEAVAKEKPLSYSEVTSGTETVLRGKIVDRAGNPQSGVYAFVYDDRVFGHQRPFGHSGRTGPDGTFAIYLDRPGVFYLGARENFGNSPRPGERFGFYDGTPDHSVTVAAGKAVEGLLIVVEPVLGEGK